MAAKEVQSRRKNHEGRACALALRKRVTLSARDDTTQEQSLLFLGALILI